MTEKYCCPRRMTEGYEAFGMWEKGSLLFRMMKRTVYAI